MSQRMYFIPNIAIFLNGAKTFVKNNTKRVVTRGLGPVIPQ